MLTPMISGVMIAIIGIKTRMVIKARILDPAVNKEVLKLCTWGSGKLNHCHSSLRPQTSV
jgi:hypothetical protein